MKKTIICAVLLLTLFVLNACKNGGNSTTKPSTNNSSINVTKPLTPTNVVVKKGIITFDEVEGADKYQLKIYQDGNFIMNMNVNSGDDISSYFDDGTYTGTLTSKKGNISSDPTDAFSFTIGAIAGDITELNELSGIDLQINEYINWSGRTYYNVTNQRMYFYYTASGFKVSFTGTELKAKFYVKNATSSNNESRLVVLVDGEIYPDQGHTVVLNKPESYEYTLATGLTNVKHTVEVLKRTESTDGTTALISVKTDGNFETPEVDSSKKILLIGASGSAGHGSIGAAGTNKTAKNSDGLRAFPYLVKRMYDTEIDEINASGWGCYWGWNNYTSASQTINIPYAFTKTGIMLSGDMNKADYDYQSQVYDLIIVNLGMNDFNTKIKSESDPDLKEELISTYKEKTQAFYELLTSTYSCPIVLLHTANNNPQAEGMYNEEIAAIVNQALGTTRIYSIIIPANGSNGAAYGANSHANVETHIQTADLIANWIETNLNWSKVRNNITYNSTRDLAEVGVISNN